MPPKGRKQNVCRFFSSPAGCHYGNKCRWAHVRDDYESESAVETVNHQPTESGRSKDTEIEDSCVGPAGQRLHKCRVALLVGYLGTGYQGLQKNPNARAVEDELERALGDAGGIRHQNRGDLQKIGWQRASRTDKGVHAARQIISARLMLSDAECDGIAGPEFNPDAQTPAPGAAVQVQWPEMDTALATYFQDLGEEGVPDSSDDLERELRQLCAEGDIETVDLDVHLTSENVWVATVSVDDPGCKFICVGPIETAKTSVLRAALYSVITKELVKGAPTFERSVVVRTPATLKLDPRQSYVERVNLLLPDDVQLHGFVRVGRSFNAKANCGGRRYEYLIPSFALVPITQLPDPVAMLNVPSASVPGKSAAPYGFEMEATPAMVEHLRGVLQLFVGTHSFHNFTIKKELGEASAKRYMISIDVSDPVSIDGMKMIVVSIVGQSFMLNQIRRMIGAALCVMRQLPICEQHNAFDSEAPVESDEHPPVKRQKLSDAPAVDESGPSQSEKGIKPLQLCDESFIVRALTKANVSVPTAPGAGLLLENLQYKAQEHRGGRTLKPLVKLDDTVKVFKHRIYKHIVGREQKDHDMAQWLKDTQHFFLNAQNPE